MTDTYLYKILTTVLDGNGNGTVALAPDAGQWWTPKIAKVGTQNKQSPVPYAAVYVGAPNLLDQTTFLDDTFLGNGDTTSMISGLVVAMPQAVTAQFIGGTPGDTAILILYGVNSDAPPAAGLLPQVPGTHFSGKPATELVTPLAFFNNLSISQPLSPGQQLIVSPAALASFSYITTRGSGNAFDVRQFTSYYFTISAKVNGGTGTLFDAVKVELVWYDDIAATQLLYTELLHFWADSSAGSFQFSGGNINMQDSMHGPYLLIAIGNPAGNDTVNVQFQLTGSTRVLSQPFFKQDGPAFSGGVGGDDSILAHTSGALAAGQIQFPLLYSYGNVQLQLVNAGAAAMTVKLDFAAVPSVNNVIIPTLAAGASQTMTTYMPKRAGLITFTGTTGQFAGLTAITLNNKG